MAFGLYATVKFIIILRRGKLEEELSYFIIYGMVLKQLEIRDI